MRCTIYSDDSVPCGYVLARVFRKHRGRGRYRWAEPNDHENTRAIVSDWDFPGYANRLRWSPRNAATRSENTRCDHSGTDGMIDCACGLTASRMIASAREWLDRHEGRTFPDPGYF